MDLAHRDRTPRPRLRSGAESLPRLAEADSPTVWTAQGCGAMRAGRRPSGTAGLLAEVLLAHTARMADQAAAAASLRGHSALSVRTTAPLVTRARTVVVTGPSGSGKTPLVRSLIDELEARGIDVAGFLQPATVEGGEKIGFRIQDASTGEIAELARRVPPDRGDFGTSFKFFDGGFELGTELSGRSDRARSRDRRVGPRRASRGWSLARRGAGVEDRRHRRPRRGRSAGQLVPALVEALDTGDVVVVDLEEAEPEKLPFVLDAWGSTHDGLFRHALGFTDRTRAV